MGTITVKATFDGSLFKLLELVESEPDTEYILTVEKKKPPYSANALDVLRKNIGTINGPPDWSDEHDHYIHGIPKRGSNDNSSSIS